MHLACVAAASIALVLLPGVAAAQKDAGKAPAPAGRWIMSKSARGIRTTDAGVELRQGAGWVFTSAIFADFTLDLEFRIIDPGTRASLFVRAFPLERPTYGSYAVNLSDAVDGTTPLGSIASGKRDLIADAAVTEARRAATKQLGTWQSLQITCDGRLMRVSVNGTEVDQLNDVLAVEGVLGLAADAGRIELRSLRIREHEAPLPPDLVADPERGLFDPDKDKSVTAPKLVKDVKPSYAPSAMLRKVQGSVSLKATVLKDGSVGDVRVSRRFDREMDRVAIATVKQWRFTPASKDGMPVDAIVEIEMSFTLR